MSLPAALDVGRQGWSGDGDWCWGDKCYRAPNPGPAGGPLGLCDRCAAEIVPNVIPTDA